MCSMRKLRFEVRYFKQHIFHATLTSNWHISCNIFLVSKSCKYYCWHLLKKKKKSWYWFLRGLLKKNWGWLPEGCLVDKCLTWKVVLWAVLMLFSDKINFGFQDHLHSLGCLENQNELLGGMHLWDTNRVACIFLLIRDCPHMMLAKVAVCLPHHDHYSNLFFYWKLSV